MPTNKQPQHEIISIEDDAKVPDTFGLERFIEEVNILELEGVYFSPNRKAGLKKSPSYKEMSSQPVTLVLSQFGQPGELAYKVLQAIFLKLTEQGPKTDGRLLISRRELASLVGISFGGKQSEELFRALSQLRYTHVVFNFTIKEQQDGEWHKRAITLTGDGITLLKTAVYESGATRGHFARCLIELDDLVLKNLQNRHISYFNWERMHGLDMVGMMLYKRFFRHMANIYREGMDKDKLILERNYEAVCSKWLGLKPMPYLSDIEKQLGKRLRALVETRLLRECRVVKRARGDGYKLVGLPGSGFFADYENMYRRKAPTPPALPEASEPLVFLNAFHKHFGHEQDVFTAKEVAHVRDLLSFYGAAGLRDFMEFGLREATKTSYNMQWFGALRDFEGRWKATLKKKAKAQERQAAVAACSVCNEAGVFAFEDGSVYPCPHDRAKLAHIHTQKPIRGFYQA